MQRQGVTQISQFASQRNTDMATLPYRPLSRDCFEISTLDVVLMLGATAAPHREGILLGTFGVFLSAFVCVIVPCVPVSWVMRRLLYLHSAEADVRPPRRKPGFDPSITSTGDHRSVSSVMVVWL
jgi:hypothetical protein